MEQKDKDELKDELLKGVGDYIKDQLSEQFKDAVAKLQPAPAPVIVTPEKPKFTSFRDFMLSVRNFRMNRTLDERLTFITGTGNKTAGHMEIGEDSQGGFLVPEIYRAELLEIALETSVVRPRATVLPMTTDSLKIPYVNDTSHASSVYGGVIAYWTAEAAAKTASKPTFGQLELTPHKLAGLTYASNELLADSAIALEPMIRRMFGTAWGYYEDDAFINGTGAGQPLGILNCGCLKSVFRNTANRVHYEDIAEM
jgi:HK97 family phage major capsid protein